MKTNFKKIAEIVTAPDFTEKIESAARIHFDNWEPREYNYPMAVIGAIRDEFEWGYIKKNTKEEIHDLLFCNDHVTGNASGSYFFNRYKAAEMVCHNLDLLGEACEDFGCGADLIKQGPEALDVIIRCYLLNGCLSVILEEIASRLGADCWDALEFEELEQVTA